MIKWGYLARAEKENQHFLMLWLMNCLSPRKVVVGATVSAFHREKEQKETAPVMGD